MLEIFVVCKWYKYLKQFSRESFFQTTLFMDKKNVTQFKLKFSNELLLVGWEK